MQSQIFKATCTAAWEYYTENFPTHSREIAKLFNPIKIADVRDAGVFIVIFTDGSATVCGSRGSTILGDFVINEVCDPQSFDEAEDEPADWPQARRLAATLNFQTTIGSGSPTHRGLSQALDKLGFKGRIETSPSGNGYIITLDDGSICNAPFAGAAHAAD